MSRWPPGAQEWRGWLAPDSPPIVPPIDKREHGALGARNGHEQNVREFPVNGVYQKDSALTKSPSPSSQAKKNNDDGKSDFANQRIPSSEEDESLSCRTLNGDNDSNEENLISQRIDLNRRYIEDGRNSTSPSSMSSNLSQHSQSSIINLINNHEAKHAASNSGIYLDIFK